MSKSPYLNEDTWKRAEMWVDTYGADVFRFIYTYTGNKALTERAFLQTFLLGYRNFQSIRRYQGERNVLLGAALSVCKQIDSNTLPNQGLMMYDAGEFLGSDVGLPVDQTGSAEDVVDSDPVIRALVGLSPELKSSFLLYGVAGCDSSALGRILLLPRRFIESRVLHAIHILSDQLDIPRGLRESEELQKRLELALGRENLAVTEVLRTQTVKYLRATMAQVHAERRHQGPSWLKYATLGIIFMAVGGVGFGLQTQHVTGQSPDQAHHQQVVKGLPAPLENLPVAVQAQFRLPSSYKLSNLDHIAVSNQDIYIPSLQIETDSWPQINIVKVAFASSGDNIKSAGTNMSSIEMVPPITQSKSSNHNATGSTTPNTDWVVKSWDFSVFGSWATAKVNWSEPAQPQNEVTQIYALYLPTGKSNLVESIRPQTGKDIHVVAIGEGKIAIQYGFHNKAAKNAVVSLPIDVYSLHGSIPLQAMGEAKQVSGSFGVMMHPTIAQTGIVFQGLLGKSAQSNANFSTWYLLSVNGQLSKYNGPPVDGQPHWVVSGSGGTLWWCETTPDPKKPLNMQVLMGALGSDPKTNVSPQTLSGSVQYFMVSGKYVAWVQDTEGQSQLVIGEAN